MTEFFFFSVARWKKFVKKEEPLTLSAIALDIIEMNPYHHNLTYCLMTNINSFLLPDEDYTERGQTSRLYFYQV